MDPCKFNKFIAGIYPRAFCYDPKEKERAAWDHISYMLSRTQSIFRWSGLPDTVPQRILELYLQINGCCAWYEHEGSVYVFTGGLGGKPDVYYMPTIFTIANPALNLSKNLRIGEDCVVMPNDPMYSGLVPMFSRYASMLTENELSIQIATINSRLVSLLSAPDDRTKEAAEKLLKDLTDGKLGVIGENAFLDGIRSQPYAPTSGSNFITNLIEAEQYIKASWYNEIGLNANYNMKRESINSGESQLNDDALLPLIDQMLETRRIAADKVNNMFGLNISVDLASAWEDNQIEIDAEQDALQDPEPEPEPEPEGGVEDVDETENA